MQIEKIDIITAAMGHALATDGGFCTGSVRVVDHQVCTESSIVTGKTGRLLKGKTMLLQFSCFILSDIRV